MKYLFLLTIFFFNAQTVYCQSFSDISKNLESKKTDFNGHLIMIVNQGDSTIYKYQTGIAKDDTKIGVASASKWISASVILTLADQKLLSLDDSIGKYLPNFTKYNKGGSTIRQCLTHTSGFPAFAGFEYKNINLAQLVDSMAKYTPMKSSPGKTFEYGEMSYRIVGRIAEVVTNSSWEELFQKNIASKCNMINSTYCWEKDNPALGSGLCTTPADYLSFMKMVLNKGLYKGTHVISESSVQEFYKSQVSPSVIQNMLKSNLLIKEIADGKNISYGLGTWLYNFDEHKEHQPEIFCPGATGTFPFIDSCRGIYGIILTNTKVSKVINTELKAVSAIKTLVKANCRD